jgi:integral membrane sensor domain MASE1
MARVLLLAAAYYLLATRSLAVASLPGGVSALWPPTGLAVGALLLAGRSLWPGVLLGSFLTNASSGLPLKVAVVMSIGNALEPLLAVTLLDRKPGFDRGLGTTKDVLAFVVRACLVNTVVCATWGVMTLVAAGVVPVSAAGGTWAVWWVADGLGSLTVGSALLIWRSGGSAPRRSPVEAVVGVALLSVIAWAAFSSQVPYPYMVFPFMMWFALRFTQRGATTAVLVTAGLAVVRTAQGYGPFRGADDVTNLWRLEVFLSVVALTSLVLAAIVTERDRALRQAKQATQELSDANATLETRVAERTADLEVERQRFEEAQSVAHIGS